MIPGFGPKLLTKLTNILMKIKDDSKFPRCGHVCCVGGAMWFSPRREISSSLDASVHSAQSARCAAKKISTRCDSVFDTELVIQYDSVLITF